MKAFIIACALLAAPSLALAVGAKSDVHLKGDAAHDGTHHGAHNPITNWYQPHWGKDHNGGELEEGEHPMAPGFLYALINFGLFAFILYRFGGTPLRNHVKRRHETILSQLEESAELREDAQRKLEEYTTKLSSLDADIQKLVGSIRTQAEKEKASILAEAQERADRLQRDTQQQIKAEMAQAKASIERKALETAVAIAGQMLEEKLTSADQERLTANFVNDIKPAQAQGGLDDW